ncbi:hypothetical protein, partial [Lentilactobacillus farraginis]|uniref:hypothetical protein n=1 Tax=Lentilactobacillus farraginis TaxID=390841 RepID=UPI001ED9B03A
LFENNYTIREFALFVFSLNFLNALLSWCSTFFLVDSLRKNIEHTVYKFFQLLRTPRFDLIIEQDNYFDEKFFEQL